MQIKLHFFTLFLHFSAKIGAFLFIPPNTLHAQLNLQPPQNHPKTIPKHHAKTIPKPFGVSSSVVGLIVPSFLGAFLAALGAAIPFGVKHHAARPRFARPVGVPSVVLAERLGLAPPPCGYRFAPLSLARACLAALLFPPLLRCVARYFLASPCAFVRCRSSRPTFVGLARVARRLAPQPLSRATTAGAALTALLAACGRLWAPVRVPSPSPSRFWPAGRWPLEHVGPSACC